ncbi:MAG: hypothetical protein ACI4RA_05980 [Kiritimatiellia bacterium]
MRLVLTVLLAALLAGCETTPWVRGSITEGLPRRVGKLPPDAAFFVEKTERRVKKSFEDALKARGFEVVEDVEACDFVLKATVEAWEYNTVGFGGGSGARDDMELSVACVDRRKRRVLARASISVRSDFRIIRKYVDDL